MYSSWIHMNKRRKGEKTKALFNCIVFAGIILLSYQNPHRVRTARGKPGKSWKIIITNGKLIRAVSKQ